MEHNNQINPILSSDSPVSSNVETFSSPPQKQGLNPKVAKSLIAGALILSLGAIGAGIYKNSATLKNADRSSAQTPITYPPSYSNPEFVGMSAQLALDAATFSFNYTGTSNLFYVDVASDSAMTSTNTLAAFGQDTQSPIVVSDPQTKWAYYGCGKTIYYRLFNVDRAVMSTVQSTMFSCPSPTVAPTGSPSPSATPAGSIKISKTNVVSTIYRKPNSTDLLYGQSFVITSEGADGWEIKYTDPTQGKGFYENTGGITPGQTATIRSYINPNKLNGSYYGSAVVRYSKGGAWFDGPKVNYATTFTNNTPITSTQTMIKIFAAGRQKDGVFPRMDVFVKNVKVVSYQDIAGVPVGSREYYEYAYPVSGKVLGDAVRLQYTNDFGTRDLRIDKIIVDNKTLQTEAATTYSTGTWQSGTGCAAGYKKSEWLNCNGYFQFLK